MEATGQPCSTLASHIAQNRSVAENFRPIIVCGHRRCNHIETHQRRAEQVRPLKTNQERRWVHCMFFDAKAATAAGLKGA